MSKKKSVPGVCMPWQEKKQEYEAIRADEKTVQKQWEDFDTLAYLYMWFLVIAA
ncbi:MAG: hypothetical protein GTO24_16860 [candidate division Zixibacteria bacterium]|nr:hypothetical protein [candidate division Zixibacteria bacterium]